MKNQISKIRNKFRLKGFVHFDSYLDMVTSCAKIPDDENDLKGLKLLPFQGVNSSGSFFSVGRCPTFMLTPFQG